VAQLEVPAPGSGRRDDLRPLDAYPEAPADGRRAYRDRGLAGGRAHRRRGALRGGRGRGERAAQGPAGTTSGPRAGQVRFHAPSCRYPCIPAATRPPPGGLAAASCPGAPGRRTHSASSRRHDQRRSGREDRGSPSPTPAPPANHHGGCQRWPVGLVQCFHDRSLGTTRARPGAGVGRPRRRDQPRDQATAPDLILTSGVREPRCIR
jgi:hypothetical protein